MITHVPRSFLVQNIQSTNWQTVRFKPPPANSSIGWRVEFRSMEVQVTDFENAAFAVFIVLLSRAIMEYQLNLYMPISKVSILPLSLNMFLKFLRWTRTCKPHRRETLCFPRSSISERTSFHRRIAQGRPPAPGRRHLAQERTALVDAAVPAMGMRRRKQRR